MFYYPWENPEDYGQEKLRSFTPKGILQGRAKTQADQ